MKNILLSIIGLGFAWHGVSIAADSTKSDEAAVQQALQHPTVENLSVLLEAAQNANNCFPKQCEASVAVLRLGKEAVPAIVAQVKHRRTNAWTKQVDNLYLLALIGPDAKEAIPVLSEIVESSKTQRYVRHFAETARAAIKEDTAALTQLAAAKVDFGDVALHALEKMVADERAAPKVLELARKKSENYLAARTAYQAKWKALGAKHNVNAASDDELTALALGDDLTQIPREVTHLKNLTSLELQGNQLAALPAEIGKLVNLAYLNLSENPITDRDLEKLKTLTSLRTLDLTETKATKDAIAKLKQALPNCKILSEYQFNN